MDVDGSNTNFRSITISLMEQFMDKCAEDRDTIFASFHIYDNIHTVSVDLMKDIVSIARKNLDISEPICLHVIIFSRVMQKQERMVCTLETIGLPITPVAVEELETILVILF